MVQRRRTWTTIGSMLACAGPVLIGDAQSPAIAQKSGGTLRVATFDSPATMSPLEESTSFSVGPMMGVFNNLVIFEQAEKQNRLDNVRPELATSWAWNGEGTELTFELRQGVKWHDGKPFTARDVECTWNYQLEKSEQKLRVNPRGSQYANLDRIEVKGEHRVVFHLKRPQPGFPALIAGGVSPVYPCHVPPEAMRRKPIGTGPFRFIDYKPGQFIKVERNPDYWNAGKPRLDAIEWTIIKNVGTAALAFSADQVDMMFPYQLTVAETKDLKKQSPAAICEDSPGTISRHVIINRSVPPFSNPEIRRAVALVIDRKAFIDIISEGKGTIGGVLQPEPGGEWGFAADAFKDLPGYDPDIAKNRREAKAIMERQGYGPNNRLKFKLTTRDYKNYRDPAIILIDQLKEAYIEAELETVDVAQYFPKLRRRDFTVGLNLQTSGPEPDQVMPLFYSCGASLNWDGYCNPELDKLVEAQSREGDFKKRRTLLWQIEQRLAAEATRPVIFYNHVASCWHPRVKGFTVQVNSIFNGYRFEDVWLDR